MSQTEMDLNRFVILDDVFLDVQTELVWALNPDITNEGFRWEAANDYCTKLYLGGFQDWRIPNLQEILLVLEMRNIPAEKRDWFWTSGCIGSDKVKWSPSVKLFAWPVRNGNSKAKWGKTQANHLIVEIILSDFYNLKNGNEDSAIIPDGLSKEQFYFRDIFYLQQCSKKWLQENYEEKQRYDRIEREKQSRQNNKAAIENLLSGGQFEAAETLYLKTCALWWEKDDYTKCVDCNKQKINEEQQRLEQLERQKLDKSNVKRLLSLALFEQAETQYLSNCGDWWGRNEFDECVLNYKLKIEKERLEAERLKKISAEKIEQEKQVKLRLEQLECQKRDKSNVERLLSLGYFDQAETQYLSNCATWWSRKEFDDCFVSYKLKIDAPAISSTQLVV